MQLFRFLTVAVGLFALTLNQDTALLQVGNDILKAFVFFGEIRFSFFNDVIRQTDLFGDRKRITFSRYADQQAVGRAERLDAELTAAVLNARCGEGKDLQLTVMGRCDRADIPAVQI